MAKNKPRRTKDQLIIDPLLINLGEIIQRLTKEKEGLIKENNELKAKIKKLEEIETVDI